MADGVSLQRILSLHYEDYQSRHMLSKHTVAVTNALIQCRTARLGGHVSKCPDGDIVGIYYNSCKNRSCPQCAHIQVERWLQRQKARLLECDHFHVIFTIATQLHRTWFGNSKAMTEIFFKSVRDSLFEMLADERRLGGEPGLLSCLQTWGRDLAFHPHIHCLVTAGALHESGEWVTLRKRDFMLPGLALMAKFRGKFLALVREAFRTGVICAPDGLRDQQFENLLNKLGLVPWNVHISERYSHGQGVVTYLGRYIKGGPISNRRLVSCDDRFVRFQYTDHRDHQEKIATMTHDEFIRRILMHIPEHRLRTFRTYGLYSTQHQDRLNQCRALLNQPPVTPPAFFPWEAFYKQLGIDIPVCKKCGRPATRIERFDRRGHPYGLVGTPNAA